MKTPLTFVAASVAALFFAVLSSFLQVAQAAPPAGTPPSSEAAFTPSPKTETVKKYVDGCWSKPAKEAGCDKLRKDAVEILKEDLQTLGSSANRSLSAQHSAGIQWRRG